MFTTSTSTTFAQANENKFNTSNKPSSSKTSNGGLNKFKIKNSPTSKSNKLIDKGKKLSSSTSNLNLLIDNSNKLSNLSNSSTLLSAASIETLNTLTATSLPSATKLTSKKPLNSSTKFNSNSYSPLLSSSSLMKTQTTASTNHASSLNEQELECAFEMLDVNNDGKISKQELKEMLLRLNIIVNDELLNQMILDVSQSENGNINKQQFHELVTKFAKVKDKEEDIDRDLWAAFQVFDRDQNGYISRNELELALKIMGENLNENEIDGLMKQIDLDNDGKISFNEFKIKFRTLN